MLKNFRLNPNKSLPGKLIIGTLIAVTIIRIETRIYFNLRI